MNEVLLLAGIVIMICILLGRFAESLPVPGMFFGVNGPIGIQFDDYSVSESICTACLIFIMFYGGFGTNIASAKPVLGKSICLSTLGVILTAGLTGAFIHFVLHLSWTESILIGSVIASTDAASASFLYAYPDTHCCDDWRKDLCTSYALSADLLRSGWRFSYWLDRHSAPSAF